MKRMIEIDEYDDEFWVKVPYSSLFTKEANKLNGKWDRISKTWAFSIDVLCKVKEFCLNMYGDDGNGYEPVTIKVNLSKGDFKRGNSIYIRGIQLCTRFSKKDYVKLSKHVIIISGKFLSWGGSYNYPEVTWDDGEDLILEVKEFPKKILENLTDEEKACITIVEDDKVEDKEFLLKEKERLLVRIAEIDKLLENM